MGQKAGYQPCPVSPKRLQMRNLVPGLLVALLVLLVLFAVFLGLYVRQASSEPAKQLQECRSQMQNQSTQMRAQIASLAQHMEEAQKAAQEKAGNWTHKAEAMNKTLAETQKNWRSCQEQLSALQDNYTSLEAKDHSQKEAVKNLHQQLNEKSKQLADEQRRIQEERIHHRAEVQRLEEQLQQKQQAKASASSSRNVAGLTLILLELHIAGLLSM
ncbi:uncharacterized protein LOC143834899 [Paroedura picta]|uniref:uncharacterized protein LOC143834899 n=1 Tax=Paroedura picta TaxID=143630 RepID=UPI0040577356